MISELELCTCVKPGCCQKLIRGPTSRFSKSCRLASMQALFFQLIRIAPHPQGSMQGDQCLPNELDWSAIQAEKL
ncbi:hypothetical protein HBI56_209110 [Parastagonospora nodorum]|uniref:Uncharacterized protein n=1 Tax=Phaeosphaeria nodorum (strain SN15 / ATCC MYA-4574 / FGSC 10173) TaxID=321614 RepID=A0A7U2I630_PHANO|nr:hypothetical protein HBH56_219690 [Parastagonospora nodorum]QRD01207.1 hypothetical protein JI435_416320 [Parastagonospora nodorum SN15]KAH3921984.1 hypothetical protein HBH54_229820 [Parastagonospora nodorum]KAH3961117.1 hypothetical protein HBH52_232460 [Parastagonospora nodorum]KAH3991639.1 hypothetical protein HBI10_229880 [Parastagonospora nodorum]